MRIFFGCLILESVAIVKFQCTEDPPIGCIRRIIVIEGEKSDLIKSQRLLLLSLIGGIISSRLNRVTDYCGKYPNIAMID